METRWTWKVYPSSGITGYDKLTPEECTDFAALRMAIFIDEQGYPYQDLDGRDPNALHLQCYHVTKDALQKNHDAVLVAYARLMLPQFNSGKLEIGRVVVHKAHRKEGLGKQLMQRMIQKIDRDFPGETAHLSVADDKFSAHLPHFYGKFGFKFKEDKTASNNPYYQYANFSCIIKNMERPAKPVAKAKTFKTVRLHTTSLTERLLFWNASKLSAKDLGVKQEEPQHLSKEQTCKNRPST